MKEDIRIQKSRSLARLLRFDKASLYDEGGWRNVSDVLDILSISIQDLREIVNDDPKNKERGKGRFELSEDESKIRARDGHAKWIPLAPQKPANYYPAVLYHGTCLQSVRSILKNGINSMERAYVHLSEDKAEALRVGSRHKDPVVLSVNTQYITDKGNHIYSPASFAWLSEEVPSEAIKDEAFIGRLVAYYESEEQGAAILNVCTNPDTLNYVMELIKSENDSVRAIDFVVSFPDYCKTVSAIRQRIAFENDVRSKAIIAYVPIPVDADDSHYRCDSESLSYLIRQLHQFCLASVILENMPQIKLKDKKRALFYLEMSMWCRNRDIKCFIPIDWNDIHKVWEKSQQFWFYPTFSENSLKELFNSIYHFSDAPLGAKKMRGVVWLTVPGDSKEIMSDIQEFVWHLRDRCDLLLFGLNVAPIQDHKAVLYLMTE